MAEHCFGISAPTKTGTAIPGICNTLRTTPQMSTIASQTPAFSLANPYQLVKKSLVSFDCEDAAGLELVGTNFWSAWTVDLKKMMMSWLQSMNEELVRHQNTDDSAA